MNWLKNKLEMVNKPNLNQAITLLEETITQQQSRLDKMNNKIKALCEKAKTLAPISKHPAINSLKLKKVYESHAKQLSNQIFTLETSKAKLEQTSDTSETANALLMP